MAIRVPVDIVTGAALARAGKISSLEGMLRYGGFDAGALDTKTFTAFQASPLLSKIQLAGQPALGSHPFFASQKDTLGTMQKLLKSGEAPSPVSLFGDGFARHINRMPTVPFFLIGAAVLGQAALTAVSDIANFGGAQKKDDGREQLLVMSDGVPVAGAPKAIDQEVADAIGPEILAQVQRVFDEWKKNPRDTRAQEELQGVVFGIDAGHAMAVFRIFYDYNQSTKTTEPLFPRSTLPLEIEELSGDPIALVAGILRAEILGQTRLEFFRWSERPGDEIRRRRLVEAVSHINELVGNTLARFFVSRGRGEPVTAEGLAEEIQEKIQRGSEPQDLLSHLQQADLKLLRTVDAPRWIEIRMTADAYMQRCYEEFKRRIGSVKETIMDQFGVGSDVLTIAKMIQNEVNNIVSMSRALDSLRDLLYRNWLISPMANFLVGEAIHNSNNLLTSLTGNIGLALYQEVMGGDPEPIKVGFLAVANSSSRRFVDIFRDVREMIEAEMARYGVKIVMVDPEVYSDFEIVLESDTEFERFKFDIVQNFMTNMVRYGRPLNASTQGRQIPTFLRFYLTEEEGQIIAVIEFEDFGEGIPYTADNYGLDWKPTTGHTDVTNSTGRGLSSARDAIGMFGFGIEIHSSKHEGPTNRVEGSLIRLIIPADRIRYR